MLTKETVLNRLRPLYEKAADEGPGVSFFLTQEESALLLESDLEQLRLETRCKGTQTLAILAAGIPLIALPVTIEAVCK